MVDGGFGPSESECIMTKRFSSTAFVLQSHRTLNPKPAGPSFFEA